MHRDHACLCGELAEITGPVDDKSSAIPITQDKARLQNGLNLFLRLKNPQQMPALLKLIADNLDAVREALASLHYVHFARFLPSPDGSTLMVITVFDGPLKAYIMDFVAVLGDIFNAMLDFVQDAPRLPVQEYPDDFWAFIKRNNNSNPGVQPWSAYPDLSVIVIQTSGRMSSPPVVVPPHEPAEPAPRIDLKDVQGNIVRGYRVGEARHFALYIEDSRKAGAFLAKLTSGATDVPQISTAEVWSERPKYRLNIAITWDGLRRLGVPDTILADFPEAFRQGAGARTKQLCDNGESAPQHWVIGGRVTGTVHLILSLYTPPGSGELPAFSATLRELFATYELTEISHHDATALPDDKVHFGYRDSIAQPRIQGVQYKSEEPDMQPAALAGDFLLGCDYRNQYRGNYAGDLPRSLADNASYGAFCVLKQDVRAFEDYLTGAAMRLAELYGSSEAKRLEEFYRKAPSANPEHACGSALSPGQRVLEYYREYIAAKLVGRWRNGDPLVRVPDNVHPTQRQGKLHELNRFDYEPTVKQPTYYDDREGLRCPMGAHIRRLNPRSSLVTGKPHSRRIIRRNLPYGPAYCPGHPDDGHERGLMGYFICGDLEMQFEFLLGMWANEDFSAPGIRGTRDPLLGAQPDSGGRFIIPTNDFANPIVLDGLPRLVLTRGRVYTFMPGIGGLRWLAAQALGTPA